MNTPRKTHFLHVCCKGNCICKLCTPNQIVGAKPLLKKLLFQMDNCVKNNKNRHLLVFVSLLMARDVFEEVKLRFIVVGHTHEDINGCFGYLSKKLKEENNYISANLMRAFIISQERVFILQLIKEIPDFKSWVLGCLKDGP